MLTTSPHCRVVCLMQRKPGTFAGQATFDALITSTVERNKAKETIFWHTDFLQVSQPVESSKVHETIKKKPIVAHSQTIYARMKRTYG